MVVIPLDVLRVLASARLNRLRDFQYGWWWRLFLEMARSGGSLPHDGQLWRLAGAQSSQFFDEKAGPVLACFERRQVTGGVEIYSTRLLSCLQGGVQKELKSPQLQVTPTNTNERGKIKKNGETGDIYIYNKYISSKEKPELQNLFEQGYKNYPRHVGKAAAEKSYYSACSKVVKLTRTPIEEAAKAINAAALEFAQTPAGQRGMYTPHMATWLNQQRFLDDRREWRVCENKKLNGSAALDFVERLGEGPGKKTDSGI